MKSLHPRMLMLALVVTLAGSAVGARAQTPILDTPNDDRNDVTPSGLTPRPTELDRDASPAQLAGPVDPRTYRLGPGDQLVLVVRGAISRDVPLEVAPEGSILVPNEGAVPAAGRMLADVRADVLARLRRLYRSVDVQLLLARPRTFRVYLTGAVNMPGPVLANGSFRVADVLAPTQLADRASQRNIEVIHTDGTSERCDLQLFLQTGNARWNPALRDGDVVQVPVGTRFIHAEGALARPGRYELGQDDSLSTLVRLAGGVLPSARLDRILVVQFSGSATPESLWMPASDALEGIANPKLADGSRVYVFDTPRYRLVHQVTVVGEVGQPGTYPIVEGRTTLSDLVAWAHGLLPTADSSAIRVHRADNLTSGGKDPEMERLLRLSRSELTSSEYEVLRTRLSAMREDYSVDWTRKSEGDGRDLLLRDSDIVRVDRRTLSVRIGGEVQHPGILNFQSGLGVATYITQAGGYTNRAWRGKVRVTRAVTGQTLLAANVKSLDAGDIIWVPERPDRTLWDNAKEVLVALSQVATIVIAIRSLR